MELFSFGMLAGAVLALIFISIVRVKNDKDIDQGSSDGDNCGDSDSDVIHDDNRDMGIHWYKFPEGSSERQNELEILINKLNVMQMILGICRTEREALQDAILYIEEKEGL